MSQDGQPQTDTDQLFSGSRSSSDVRSTSGDSKPKKFGNVIHLRAKPNQAELPEIRRTPLPQAPADIVRNKPIGRYRQLVLLLRFKNHRDRKLPERHDIDAIFNQRGGHPVFAPSGSVVDFAEAISNHSFTVQSRILPWIDLPETEQYYANGKSGDISRIVEAIEFGLRYADENNLVDFREFDRNSDRYTDIFSVIHSGYGAEERGEDVAGVSNKDRIWSHQFRIVPAWESRSGVRFDSYAMSAGLTGVEGSSPVRVGLLAHEMSHVGDLPDLYDGDGGGNGIGYWGVLGYGDGFKNDGHTPSHLNPWAKHKFEWIPERLIKDLTEPGTYHIKQIEDFPDIYRIKAGFPEGEYLLIENRQPVNFDVNMPGNVGGLAIWHIDENKEDNNDEGHPGIEGWPENNRHYKVALVQADGRFHLERGENYGDRDDLFRSPGVNKINWKNGLSPYRKNPSGTVRHRITQISEPGRIMSFRYDIGDPNEDSIASAPPKSAAPATPRPTDDESGQNEDQWKPNFSGARPNGTNVAAGSSPVIPVLSGIQLAFDQYSNRENRKTETGHVLLEAQIETDSECVVHVRGSATVSSDAVDASIISGIAESDTSTPRMWQTSVRIHSTTNTRRLVNLSVNCRRTLPAGRHRIQWIVKSRDELTFPGGGVLTVQACRTYPKAESSDDSLTSR